MIAQKQLDKWRRLADAATPGEWWLDFRQVFNGEVPYINVCVTTDAADIAGLGEQEECQADAAFIAAAREAVPALLDEVERLRAELADARAATKQTREYATDDRRRP